MSTKPGLIPHFSIPMSKTPGDYFSKTHIKSHYFIIPFVSVFNNSITALGSAGYTKHFTLIVCNRYSSHKVEIMMFLSIYTCGLVGQSHLPQSFPMHFQHGWSFTIQSTSC